MATSEYIRLTPDMQSKRGGLWSRVVSLFQILKNLAMVRKTRRLIFDYFFKHS